ncbi:hypothetical protein TrVFT333_005419 [Trichoderma virens FT-333]|nr:hypothetical protein TrVFT333_005419 [Trichoderma virens FT-333]
MSGLRRSLAVSLLSVSDIDIISDFIALLRNLEKNHASDAAPKVHPLYPPLSNREVTSAYNNVARLLGTVPAIFIGEVSGRAEGAGNELLVQMDMGFASTGALLGASDAAIGLTHTIGGLQHLKRLIGLGRATKYLLAAKGADAKTAAEFGWVNQAFDTKDEMESYVDNLAARIGVFTRQGLEAAKRGIRYGSGPGQRQSPRIWKLWMS